MNAKTFTATKKEANMKLRKVLNVKTKYRPVGIVKLQDKDLVTRLINWLKEIPAFVIVVSNEPYTDLPDNIVILKEMDMDLLPGVDFKVCDNEICNFDIIFKNGIVPIVHNNFHMSPLLDEFNPAKATWNAFYYANENEFAIIYAIIRYMENYKFPYDNKKLVQNVIES